MGSGTCLGEIMKTIKVSDADYETLMDLSKELQLQPNHGQAFPYYWEPRSDNTDYDLNGEGEFKMVVLDSEEYDPVELAEEEPDLFWQFLAYTDIIEVYSEWDGDLKEFLETRGNEWIEFLCEEKGYTLYTYNMKPKRDRNPSLFLDDVRGYIERNQHHLGANAHTYANTIQRMPRMEALTEALYRLNPQPEGYVCNEAWRVVKDREAEESSFWSFRAWVRGAQAVCCVYVLVDLLFRCLS